MITYLFKFRAIFHISTLTLALSLQRERGRKAVRNFLDSAWISARLVTPGIPENPLNSNI